MKHFKISSCFNLHCASKENISEYIRAGLDFYKEHGLDSVDFGTTLLDLSTDNWRPAAEQAAMDAKETGISFGMCHLPFIDGGGAKDEAYLALFDKKMHNAIDAAVILGSPYAVVHPTSPTVPLKAFDRKARYDDVVKHLAPYVEHANRVGLEIVVENMRVIPGMRLSHRYCQTPDELCEVADTFGLGVCWDFGHANISGLRQSESLAYVGKRLKVIHINDNTGIDDDHVAPFMGNVDWRDAMHGLALTDYNGPFNFEINTARIPASARPAFANYLTEVAKELISYIE